MSELDPARLEVIRSLLAFDRAAPEDAERVLPGDVDLDREVDRLFAEIAS
ncbi:MAG TPA: hypothetical protein VFR85_09970 [Anaeromyxobacteraceae bacterium]|nr:hypothetical protein [Anaeromyxobacteraceae bacterium]